MICWLDADGVVAPRCHTAAIQQHIRVAACATMAMRPTLARLPKALNRCALGVVRAAAPGMLAAQWQAAGMDDARPLRSRELIKARCWLALHAVGPHCMPLAGMQTDLCRSEPPARLLSPALLGIEGV